MKADWTTSGRQFIRRHLLELSIVFMCLVLGLVMWQMNELRLEIHRSTAIETASAYMDAYEGLRKVYTSEVVPSVVGRGIKVTHNYKNMKDAIPLPVSFVMAWAKEIGAAGKGVEARIYSDFPFPWNKEGGPKDRFEESALENLRRNPEKPYFEFESSGREWKLRYARADRMQSSCVECHNSHPQSPKTNWKVGDVRGVLEVTLPMNVVNFAGIRLMRERLFLMIVITGLGFGLVLAALKWIFKAPGH